MKPYTLLSLFTVFFALNVVDGFCQAKKERLHRFYDFNVSIESRKGLYPIINRQKLEELDKESLNELYQRSEWKYIIQNVRSYFDEETGKEVELKEDVLYFVQYLHFRETENSPVVREAVDTLKIKLKKSQLDSVYTMAQQLFMLDDKPNLSPYEIPPPPVPDGEWAHVDFDLGYRGNRYRVTIKQPRQKEYSNLYNYLENIKKQSITTPIKY
jgi:hypothetical protein